MYNENKLLERIYMQDGGFNSENYLYYMLEAQRAYTAPLRLGIDIAAQWFNNESNPFYDNGHSKIMRAYLVLAERMTRKYEKPEFNIKECIVNDKVYSVKEEVVVTKDFCLLKHFSKVDNKNTLPKLLIVAPMAGHHATLLRETTQQMLSHCDVYITDWTEANMVPEAAGKFDMDDFIDYLIEFITFLGPEVHILAVCQPTIPVLAATSIMSANDDVNVPKSMILMGGPIDARKNPTAVDLFAISKNLDWFRQTVTMKVPPNYPGYGRTVYPGFLQLAGFISLNLPRHIDSHLELLQSLLEGDQEKADHTIKFYDEYLASMDMNADFYLQTIEEVFHEFALAQDKLVSRGREIHLKNITKTALLAIEGEHDDIAGVGQTKAALDMCSNIPDSKKRYYLQEGAGHYGVFSGSKYRKFIVPVIRDFIYSLHDTSNQPTIQTGQKNNPKNNVVSLAARA